MIKAIISYSAAAGGYARPLFGIGSPIVIAIITILTGLILSFVQWRAQPEFFRRKLEIANAAVLDRAGDPA
jgi:hypothetical protein